MSDYLGKVPLLSIWGTANLEFKNKLVFANIRKYLIYGRRHGKFLNSMTSNCSQTLENISFMTVKKTFLIKWYSVHVRKTTQALTCWHRVKILLLLQDFQLQAWFSQNNWILNNTVPGTDIYRTCATGSNYYISKKIRTNLWFYYERIRGAERFCCCVSWRAGRRGATEDFQEGCRFVFISSGSGSSILGWTPIPIRIHPDPIRIQGFNDQNWKKIQLKIFFLFFFLSKTAIYLGLHKVLCPSYRRSLQLSKEASQNFKTWTFT